MAARRSHRRRATHSAKASPSPLVLDSGVVVALARHDAWAQALLAEAVDDGAEVIIPAVVVAETVRGRGPRDAPVNRVIDAMDRVVPTDEEAARTAGLLLGKAKSNATIDALVVAAALHVRGRILTTDADDFARLAQGAQGLGITAV